jgi:glutathione S-transferase
MIPDHKTDKPRSFEVCCIRNQIEGVQTGTPAMVDAAAFPKLKLVSFDLCPYVQRAAIALLEKGVPFERINVDLSNKPDWFKKISPLGKVPLLIVERPDAESEVIFESAVIVEYLEDILPHKLHPADPLDRARHRSWMEFGSSILADIWTIETTNDRAAFKAKLALLREKFARIENELSRQPYFAGETFSLVDAVFAPVFRYFDTFDQMADLHVFDGLVKVKAWRKALAVRPSVRSAVVANYSELLGEFVLKKNGVLAEMARVAA